MVMERVWDYPRPPVIRPSPGTVRIELADRPLAISDRALRVLETSHPPTVYVPRSDIVADALTDSARAATWCEYKGRARYLDAVLDGRRSLAVGWFYPEPSPGYEALRDHVAFYPGRVDAAWRGEERVQAQDGAFYGGWITSDLVGPFKGAPGTLGW
jgi:uncharacterized protein (DUF427 family)